MLSEFDVIIVGAGPAGSIAAHQLAVLGVRVLILEKSPFPRYKVCGGGLTHKILREIPFDVQPVVETRIHRIRFSSGFSETFTRTSDDPLMYCTMRDHLDAHLAGKAVQAGACIIHGTRVTGISERTGFVDVLTSGETYRSTLVIGAEGASGLVARSCGLWKNILPGLAWEAEVLATPDSVSRFSQTVFLEWGSFPGGYGWLFPKGDHFSIGVGGPAGLSKKMIPYYRRFLKYLGEETSNQWIFSGNTLSDLKNTMTPDGHRAVLSMRSWPIPVRVKKSRFHNGQVMITGDAAGLTDPLTGEGIYHAIRSGKLAARTCADFLEGKVTSLQSYSDSVNGEIMTELMEANRIKNLFNTVPLTIHRLVRDNERVWRAFGKVLRGERCYADVRRGFGPWKAMWGTACRLSGWISYLKERKFMRKEILD